MGYILLAAVAVVTVALYAFKRFFDRRGAQRGPLPPGPKGLPLLGNILDLPPDGSQEWLHWHEHKTRYGPISSVTVLGQPIVILNDYEAAVELLDKRSAIYSDRPRLPMGGEMVGWEYGPALIHYGDGFRRYRRAYQKFMGTRTAAAGFTSLEELETRRFLVRLMHEGPATLVDHIRRMTGAIILKLSHGYTIQRDGEDPLIALADNVLNEFALSSSPGVWLVDVFPFLKHAPDWMPGTAFKRLAARWRSNVEEFIERPYAFVRAQAAAGTAPPSFVSTLLADAKTSEDFRAIKWSAAGVYGGGADTTVSAIKSFFLAMARHPAAAARAQAELDSVVGTDRLPVLEDREKLPYVEALYHEVLRWNPVAPMGIAHSAVEDGVYEGYFIPKGAMLLPNQWGFGHDEMTHKDPMVFKPERFLGVNGHVPEMDPRNYIFGFGRRICPGKEIADSSVWITIAMTLAAFNIGKAKDANGLEIEPIVDYSNGIISHPKDFSCTITPRSEKAAALVLEVEEEHPYEPSDAPALAALKWDRANAFSCVN